jgi:CDP-glucose 4,6-dehydratase
MDFSFYTGKKILMTGHTGFKGTWLCKLLLNQGAKITGYSLEPPTNPSLFQLLHMDEKMDSVIGDIRDFDKLKAVFDCVQPEMVFHLAAQPLVRDSYKEPKYTYETNVLGTVNILECVRMSSCVKSFLNVTTDKVYANNEQNIGFTEDMPLDGYDPYSNSKSCSELITHSYQKSFLNEMGIAVSTARAGNVIGGGDFANDRIIPDCIRAAERKETIQIRNPHSTRPFQHVLEPLCAYLMIAMRQYTDKSMEGYYNVGPEDQDCVTTGTLVTMFCEKWGQGMSFEDCYDGGPHEAGFLKLNCDKLKSTFDWKPKWGIEEAIEKTVEWSKVYFSGNDINKETDRQIEVYLK